MPYVPPAAALNLNALSAADLAALRREAGPPPWRRPLVATPAARWVLSEWPAGFVAPAHWHPNADETFHVLQGQGAFRFGPAGGPDGAPSGPPAAAPEVVAGAGTFLFAPRGLAHAIRVPGPESLLLLVCVSPNESRPDETVEAAPAGAA